MLIDFVRRKEVVAAVVGMTQGTNCGEATESVSNVAQVPQNLDDSAACNPAYKTNS